MSDLVEKLLTGDRLALSRLLSQVETGGEAARQLLKDLFPHTGRAHIVGITGAPGTGKSSLVARLAAHCRLNGVDKVAILAIDPSSPFSGGAVLGDRIRMQNLSGDPGIFIRSAASRGQLGGLAASTAAMTHVFDAAGFELILIETVGAGQAETDIARLADTTVVVEAPGLGDDIQAIKAGMLEIADILVVNKADKPGVDNTIRALKSMLNLAHPIKHSTFHHGRLIAETAAPDAPEMSDWTAVLLKTSAQDGTGIEPLYNAIQAHRRHQQEAGDPLERARLIAELDGAILQGLIERWQQRVDPAHYSLVLEQIRRRELSPGQAAEVLLA
jgi:LAO/AO transport system kinase